MKPQDAPHYIPGTIVMAACMGCLVIVIIVWKFWLMYVNKKKAKAIAAMGISPEEAEKRGQELGAKDVTDLKNPYSVYVPPEASSIPCMLWELDPADGWD